MPTKSLPLIITISLVAVLTYFLKSNKEVEDQSNTTKIVAAQTTAVTIPEKVSFAGEPIPIDVFDVRERLDRELLVNTYWHSNSIQYFKLAYRWFPVIEEILEEEGVPNDFKYLALAESGLRNVVSYRNAAGVWQFLKGTGREYGLEVNSVIDERYHIEKSTRAACAYLKEAREDLGSWTLAAASYNAGKRRLKNLLSEQKVDSYYEMYLNEETRRYVFRIVALKVIFANPQQFGFNFKEGDLYEPLCFGTLEIDYGIDDLPQFAIEQGTNYKTLKLLNPWMRQPYLRNRSKRNYTIKLPG